MASAMTTLALIPLAIILLAMLETVVAQNVELTQCPAGPLETCLFYFAGYDSTVPVINLSTAHPDAPVSPAVMDYLGNTITVEVDTSGPAAFMCPANGIPYSGDQFYLSGEPASVRTRTFNTPVSFFENKCIIVTIAAARVTEQGGGIINLDANDSFDSAYPRNKRCVVFKTGPVAPAPGFCFPSRPLRLLLPEYVENPYSTASPPIPTPAPQPLAPLPSLPIPTPAPLSLPPLPSPPIPTPAPLPLPALPPLPSLPIPTPAPLSLPPLPSLPIPTPAPSPLLPPTMPPFHPPPPSAPLPSPPTPLSPSPSISPSPAPSQPPSSPPSAPPNPLLSPPPPSFPPLSPPSPPKHKKRRHPHPPPHPPPFPPPPSPPNPVCKSACARPIFRCDFYFTGHRKRVPTFTLTRNGGQLSPVLRVKKHGTKVYMTAGVKRSTTSINSMCPRPAHPRHFSQFYAIGQKARVYSRTLRNSRRLTYFRHRCVKLTLANIQLNHGGNTTKLRPGDGNKQYREARRCVVFKTK